MGRDVAIGIQDFGKLIKNNFFSIHHAGCGSLFENFNIWQHKEHREL